ncbi:hypothetical protein [Nocardiopsis sp. JB363]|uniref:hypothetical protein n=1 Tax=Nocardiopsis sp. JB363 TaxID=1434837 RepID=UPI00097B4D8C|nr:hypothetical protein [Nocardiopsis sp. JB363]SIO84628.1 hypothetical protein BQ8420_02870 [Nocardiopsis sp. JB363]
MNHADVLALMGAGRMSLYEEIEVETTDGTAAGRLADVDADHLWADLDEDEHGAQDDPWSTALGAITALYRMRQDRCFWEPRLEQIWPPGGQGGR